MAIRKRQRPIKMKLRIYALFVFDVVGECKKHVKRENKKYCYEKMKEICSIGCHFFLYSESPLAIQRPLFPNNPR